MKSTYIGLAVLLTITCACEDEHVHVYPLDAGAADAAPIDAPSALADAAGDADLGSDAAGLPASLRDTGLYSDFDSRAIAEGVLEYTPAYPAWGDGAVNQRWSYLPPGTAIDTSDMDRWVFPEGTKLWQEFTSDGVKLETRFLWKAGPSAADWDYVSYAWNAAQSDAVAMPDGAQDVLGTGFDIPEQRDCRKCHHLELDIVLGFGAVQLAHNGVGVNLDSLITDSRMTVNPTGSSPYYAVPGSGVEQAVIGYLHGNCGSCHHKDSPVPDYTALNVRLEVASLASVEGTTTYTTIVDVGSLVSLSGVTKLIAPGSPTASAVYVRMDQRGTSARMPPRGSEVIDAAAMANLSQWIINLGQ